MGLQLVPMRFIIQQGSLQLNEDFSQKVALLLLYSGLVPHCNLQHVLSEVPSMDMRVHKRLVPLGLQTFLHCLRPSLALITSIRQEVHFNVGVSGSCI